MMRFWKTLATTAVLCHCCIAADIVSGVCDNGSCDDRTTLMQMKSAVHAGKDREVPFSPGDCKQFDEQKKLCLERTQCQWKPGTFYGGDCVPSKQGLEEEENRLGHEEKEHGKKALSKTQDGEADVEERVLWGTVKSEEAMELEAAKIEADSKRLMGSCIDGKPPKATLRQKKSTSSYRSKTVWRCDDFMSVNEVKDVVKPFKNANGNDLFEQSDSREIEKLHAGQLMHPRKHMHRTAVLDNLPLPLPSKETFLLQYPKAAEISCSYELEEEEEPSFWPKTGKDGKKKKKSGPVKALEGINGILKCMQEHAQLVVDENVPLMKKRKAALDKAEAKYKKDKSLYEEKREIESQEANAEYTAKEKELKQLYQCGPQEEAIYFFKHAAKEAAKTIGRWFGFVSKKKDGETSADKQKEAFNQCLVTRKTEITAARALFDARMKLFDNKHFAEQRETWEAAKIMYKKQRDEVSGAEFQVKYLPKIRKFLGSSIVMKFTSLIGDVLTTSTEVAGGIATVIKKTKSMEDALTNATEKNKTGGLKLLKEHTYDKAKDVIKEHVEEAKDVIKEHAEEAKEAIHNATIGKALELKDEVISGIKGAIGEQTDQVLGIVDKVKNGKLSDLTGKIPLIGDLSLADFKSEESLRFFVDTKIKGGVNDALDTAWASLMELFWTPIDTAMMAAQSALVSLLGSIPFAGGVLAAVVPPTIGMIYKLLKKMANAAIHKIFSILKEKVVMKFVNHTIDVIFNHTFAKVYQAVEPHITNAINKVKEAKDKVEDFYDETKDMFQKVSDLATDDSTPGSAEDMEEIMEGASEVMGQKYSLEDGDMEGTDVEVLQDLQGRRNSVNNNETTDYYHFQRGSESCPRLGLDSSGKLTQSTYTITDEMECKMAAEVLGFKYIKETDSNCKSQFCATPTKGCHAEKLVCSPQDSPCHISFQTKDNPGAAADETLTICATPLIVYSDWGAPSCPEGTRPLNSLECKISKKTGRATSLTDEEKVKKGWFKAKKGFASRLKVMDDQIARLLPHGCLQRTVQPEKFDGILRVSYNNQSKTTKAHNTGGAIYDKVRKKKDNPTKEVMKQKTNALLQDGEGVIPDNSKKEKGARVANWREIVQQNARVLCFQEDDSRPAS